jgi:hypothetical protein
MPIKPYYDDYWVYLPTADGAFACAGDLDDGPVRDALIAAGSFLYKAENGVIHVRLERKVRGSADGYWVAYKRRSGRLHKTYLCEASALDPYNLYAAARRLLS